ncbi:phytoene desaturase family protein [Evansella tamaricis]|uniref:phytoene desaturase family protein n=1 Tax=Evansella tamaricis TaxID=2069301 RepID=UPI001FE40DD3|nr:hypothetical protein [Evansella tamaricis]
MHAQGMEQLAKKIGVTIHINEEVQKAYVMDRKVTAVETTKRQLEGDVFLFNGDLLTQYPRLIKEEHRPSFSNKHVSKIKPSVSAFVILAASNKRHALHHHHVFFGENYEEEFHQLFYQGRYGKDPTIYICTSSKTDPTISPDGDNLFILVNAPPLKADGSSEIDKGFMKDFIFEKLENRGLHLRDGLVETKIVDPLMIAQTFHAFRGSLYGMASNRKKDTFLRPFNRSGDLENIYFVGGSTHPGGGSPMVVLSGRNVAEQIIKDYRL